MPHKSAVRIALLYGAMAALWVLLSDTMLSLVVANPSTLTMLQTLKGWVFVGVTALLLYFLVRHQLRRHEQSERVLHDTESRYRELVENATYGIFRCTTDGTFLAANRAFVKLLGYKSREDLKRRGLLRDIFPETAEGEILSQEIRAGGSVERAEAHWKRKDGTPIIVQLSGRGFRDPKIQGPVFEGIIEDVTERRALEGRNQLLQKFEAIGKLAGGIAHDFNNVLGTVIGYADLALQRSPEDHQVRRYLEIIHDQGQRGAGLTRQLLAFARRQILEPRNVDVNQVVAETLSLLRNAIGAHIEVKKMLAPDLSAARVDPTQLEQILMNLCLNARDAMPDGGQLLIETRNVELDEDYCRRYAYAHPGRYVLLLVSDTGMGMDKATVEHIFEPFFTTKEPGKGTGLGLATVYGIVKQHGGLIHAYSEPGQGSVFRVYLPVGSGKAEIQKKVPEDEVRGGVETILVAEDHDAGREMAQEVLEKLGYTVVVAANGEEAVREFRAKPDNIALVILDIVMPKLTGPEAYKQIRTIKPDLPVLFATGYSTESELLKAITDREHPLIQKPYTIRLLARKVREVIDASAVHTSR